MSSSSADIGKRAAAFAAVDAHVSDGMVVGVGSGSTVVHAAVRLGERVKQEGLRLKCVPTSFQVRNDFFALRNGNAFQTSYLAAE